MAYLTNHSSTSGQRSPNMTSTLLDPEPSPSPLSSPARISSSPSVSPFVVSSLLS